RYRLRITRPRFVRSAGHPLVRALGPLVGALGPLVGALGPLVRALGPLVGALGPLVGALGPLARRELLHFLRFSAYLRFERRRNGQRLLRRLVECRRGIESLLESLDLLECLLLGRVASTEVL